MGKPRMTGLKWKNGAAKCGPFKLEVCQCWPNNYWYSRATLRDYNFPLQPWGEKNVRTYGIKELAQSRAEDWLRKHAEQMLKDLGDR